MSGLKALGARQPVIVAFSRTAIGSFNGALKGVTAPDLGATVMQAALAKCGSPAVDEVFMGNVVSSGVGQAPATQAVIKAGLGEGIPATTVNKVCASGMKTIMLGAQAIALGQRRVVVAGGMESMSNIPHYLPNSRGGFRLGDAKLLDGLIYDGLWDPYGNVHMGVCAEKCAKDMSIGRQDQDAFAAESYRRSLAAADIFATHEIAPVQVAPGKSGKPPVVVSQDQEPANFDENRLLSSKPAFQRDQGTVTAVNASKINDGAAAVVLMSRGEAEARGLPILASIRGFGDAQRAPVDFTIAPALAVPEALDMAGLAGADVDLHEINEAFAVVTLANAELLNLDIANVNVHGGAVSLGHPIGCSGTRIVGSLCSALEAKSKSLGVASICNGGGGASAIVLEKEG